jgi:serine/threonine-protein kinase
VDLVAGTVVGDRFRLLRPLGQGGMGAVWLAQQLSLDVPCALKFLHAEAASMPDVRGRFEREAKIAAQLRGANVVHILDHGVWLGRPFIAMELLEGEDLYERLTRVRVLTPEHTATIVTEVARALVRAHGAGLVHRDLKPANIFLVREPDREVVKVLDFGIAKSTRMDVGGSKTKTGAVMGTAYYMSPEQARGDKDVDHRTDLWALGVIAYECLVGARPFEADALGLLFMRIMVEPLPVPSKVASVPRGFDAWWAKAAERDPNARFQSAKEMADALSVALGLATSRDASPSSVVSTPSMALPLAQGSTPAAPQAAPPSEHLALASTSPLGSPLTVAGIASEVAGGVRPAPRARRVVVGLAAAVSVIALGGGAAVYLGRRASPEGQVQGLAAASAPPTPLSAPVTAEAQPAVFPAEQATAVPTASASAAASAAPSPPPSARQPPRSRGGGSRRSNTAPNQFKDGI